MFLIVSNVIGIPGIFVLLRISFKIEFDEFDACFYICLVNRWIRCLFIYLPCKRLFFLEKDYSLVFCVNVPRVTRNDVQAVFCGFHYFFVSAIKGRFWMIWLELIGLIKVTKSQNVFSISSHLQNKIYEISVGRLFYLHDTSWHNLFILVKMGKLKIPSEI